MSELGFPTILLTRKDFRQMFHMSFGFSSPGWCWSCVRAVFFCQLLSKLLLNPNFLSFGSKLSVTFSPTESSPAILLFYLWIFLLCCQSCLGSGVSQVHHCLLVPSLKAQFVMLSSGTGPCCTCWCLVTLCSTVGRARTGKSGCTVGLEGFLSLKY